MDEDRDNTLLKGSGRHGSLRRLSGILLTVIGVLWLAHKAGWIPVEHGYGAVFWPLVVIAIGLLMFLGSMHGKKGDPA